MSRTAARTHSEVTGWGPKGLVFCMTRRPWCTNLEVAALLPQLQDLRSWLLLHICSAASRQEDLERNQNSSDALDSIMLDLPRPRDMKPGPAGSEGPRPRPEPTPYSLSPSAMQAESEKGRAGVGLCRAQEHVRNKQRYNKMLKDCTASTCETGSSFLKPFEEEQNRQAGLGPLLNGALIGIRCIRGSSP